MNITDRKNKILSIIIKEYIKSAEPISSSAVANKLSVSSATIRNEMVELEELGYITHPHTSAGRIPTEQGYLLYINNLKVREIKVSEAKELDKFLDKQEEENLKQAAKLVAELSGQAVFWAFHKNNLYYTGVSNLFQQPEFQEYSLVQDVSLVIDRMEDIIGEIFDTLPVGSKAMVGQDNPFGDIFSTLTLKYGDKKTGLLGILGPLRMDYEKNISLLNYLDKKLNS